MNSERMSELLRADPFKPFRVILNSGQSYEIVNPGLAVPMKFELFLALSDGERFVFCPYRNIDAVESLQAA